MATIAIGVSPGGGGTTARVPVDSLSEDGVPPEEGDDVQFSVQGTVQSVSGGTATVKIESVNGEPVGAQSDQGSAEEEGEEETPPGAGGGPSGPASGADGIGRPIGAAPMRPFGNMMTSTGETTAQLGKRLRKAARGRPLGGIGGRPLGGF